MDELTRYLELIVEPTFAEFTKNPGSDRHAFLACLVTYHAIDRVSYPKKPGNLRKKWGQHIEFKIVDIIAHHFKHVRSDDEKHEPNIRAIPLPALLFAQQGTSKPEDKELAIDLHNLYFVVRNAIKFLRTQAGASHSA